VNLTGVWDWIISSNDDDNNRRIEQEEWHLSQDGDQIDGFYLRTVTVVSGDENLFRCNGEKRFQKRMRFRVHGRMSAGDVALRETDIEVEPGPCGTAMHALQAYIGRANERSLTLMWETEMPSGMHQRGQQVLFRRPPGDEPQAGIEVPAHPNDKRAFHAEAPAALVTGTWTWETHGVDFYGDTKVEQEEWHLAQTGNELRGYYDRIVTSISSDGLAYRCNQQTQYATYTRYQVEGVITGHEIRIRELSYDAKPSACEERPQRRLDSYAGTAEESEIRLSWGSGQQVLKRSHPQVPTSTF
jgi:hypothetical protein